MKLNNKKLIRLTGSIMKLGMVFAFVCALQVTGAPYFGEPITYSQPDGSEITVYLYGDEFLAYAETKDGYIVTKDPETGYFCYARIKPDGSEVISTGVRVGRAKPPGLKPKLRLPPEVAKAKHKQRRELLGFGDDGRMVRREEPEEKPAPSTETKEKTAKCCSTIQEESHDEAK